MQATPTEIARRALTDHLAALPPAELLKRYSTRRDPEAFAGLVQQFGPMVLGTCRRVLGTAADVDDAFQAVFLSLARQADSFRDAQALPAWLHRVALRVSHKALARRAPASAPAEAVPDPADPYADVAWKDVRRALDEELDALPDKYRGPVVLCWLDGLTQDEAAGKLGVSLATLKRRLDAGRELLRSRLLRRGLAPALAAAAMATPTGLNAVVPESLKLLAVELGVPEVAVPTAVEALRVVVAVAAPARGYLKVALALVLVGGVATAGVLGVNAFRQKEPPKPPAKPPEEDPIRTVRLDGPEEPLPPGAEARFGTTRFRVPLVEDESVEHAALSKNGRYLALSTQQSPNPLLLRIYDVTDWRLVREWNFDKASRYFSLSPSGSHLAVYTRVSPDKEEFVVRIFDVRTGASIKEFPAPQHNPLPDVRAFSFTEDGRLFLWYADRKRLTWFDPVEGTETSEATAEFPDDVPNGLTPDGRFVFRPTRRGNPKPAAVFDVRTGVELKAFPRDQDVQNCFSAYAPNGETGALVRNGINDSVLDLWDTRTWAARTIELPKQPGVPLRVFGTWFSRDSRVVAVQMWNGNVLRWDVATGQELPTLETEKFWKKDYPVLPKIHPLSFLSLPDNRTVLTPCKNGLVRIWDGATGKETPVPDRYGIIVASDASADGRYVAIADDQGRIDVRDAAGRLVRTIRESAFAPVVTVKLSRDGSMLAVEDQTKVSVWRVADGHLFPHAQMLTFPGDRARPIGFDAQNKNVLVERFKRDWSGTGGLPGYALLRVEIGTGVWERHPDTEMQRRQYVASPDGRIVIAYDEGAKRLIRLEEGKPRRLLAPGADRCVAVSPDGEIMLATFADVPNWRLCSAETGEVIRSIEYKFHPCDYESDFAVSSDGRYVFATCRVRLMPGWKPEECRPRLIDTVAGKVVAEFAPLPQPWSRTAGLFTPDGKGLVTFDQRYGYRWDIDKLIAAQKK